MTTTNHPTQYKGWRTLALPTALSLVLAACASTPYTAPAFNMPAQFKEAPAGWKNAEPADTATRGLVWQSFGDAQLDALIAKVDTANENLHVAEAHWRQAAALGRQARAALFPTLGAGASDSRGTTGSSAKTSIANTVQADLSANWEVDLWGRLHNLSDAQTATAQASLADVANTRLSLEAELASDYFALRVADAQQALLNASVAAYADSLALTRNRYAAGVAAQSEVTLAETQWLSAQTQAEDLSINRAQLEHVIAVLVGQAPADFSLPVAKQDHPSAMLPMQLPALPVSLPSSLLERRPDIAASERQVAAANASIGAARAALFPALTLSADGGYRNTGLGDLFGIANRFWSLGPSLAMTIFDAGAKQAGIAQAQASYDATVANYRQTVLNALQNVEDQLVALRVLGNETVLQAQATRASAQTVALTLNQYRAGTVPYLNVLTAQVTDQNAQRNALDIKGRQLAASVQLIKALGGGWQVDSGK
ncbi:MAG: efflux transporter outer membrane subunit [Formivibrio sp.]|nr:efflux transporter outer membrane subunit [Formivibrio sp.]